MLAPSQIRAARKTRRRSGGVVSTTNAAAAPAETRMTFATVRARLLVTLRQLRRDPPAPPDDEGVEWVVDAPDSPPRIESEPLL